jgi:hypothetical protein
MVLVLREIARSFGTALLKVYLSIHASLCLVLPFDKKLTRFDVLYLIMLMEFPLAILKLKSATPSERR